ncbi:MAG: BREX-1 system adenine-specific DNA-methyltransferase PglX [Candidatus Cloacimonetes bacterium]|nr:BREX-1 system adenine-specific DNA-methyltransferase PglX [Candidatus Cloacimonadota bacterium]
MSRVVLSHNFSIENWIDYFDRHSDYFNLINTHIRQHQNEEFKSVIKLGSLDLPEGNTVSIFLMSTSQQLNERSYRRKQFNKSVDILKAENTQAGLFVFYDEDNSFRFSLIYSVFKGTKRSFSSYKRYSYFISADTPHHTYKQQIGFVRMDDLQSIKEAFSVEPVTNQFFIEISLKYLELVGGDRKIGTKLYKYPGFLVLPVSNPDTNKEFAVRLLGRIIFCWFLKLKRSINKLPLIPSSLISSKAVEECGNRSYYHKIIEPLFFEVLNKNRIERNPLYRGDQWDTIPFLNGGLFEHDSIDFYSPTDTGLSAFVNTVKIPNQWFYDLFSVFERYNFTVDESTSTDIEIAVDPEMLGKIFENLLAELDKDTGETARKKTGSYYTPREVVEYIVDISLFQHLKTHVTVDESSLRQLIESPENPPNLKNDEIKSILDSISSLKIIDPACGSGAFVMGAMQKMIEIIKVLDPSSEYWKDKIISSIKDPVFRRYIVEKLKTENLYYTIKLGLIRDNIYGVDILPMAVEISKLRFFLSLVVDETIDDTKDNRGILALPNLDFKFIAADYVLDLASAIMHDSNYTPYVNELKIIIDNYFTAYGSEKEQIKNQFLEKQNDIAQKLAQSGLLIPDIAELLNWNPFSKTSVNWFNPEWMLGLNEDFDIIIANPPYVSNKNTDKSKVPLYLKKYGFSDDLYNYFFIRSLDMVKTGGILSFISSNTYLSINSKQNLRKAFLDNRIIEIFKIDNPFENPMVSPAIITLQKTDEFKNHDITFKIAEEQEDFLSPSEYKINTSVFKNTAFNTYFPPTEFNMRIWDKYGKQTNRLMAQYWAMIDSSKAIARSHKYLDEYRRSLKPGDLTLLGLVTEGGQGLATADNGRFVGVKEKTKEAYRIKTTRAQKLYEAIVRKNINQLGIDSLQYARDMLADLSETEIRNLFNNMKRDYGRDIFGSGYLYQIITESEIADPAQMSLAEISNGIKTGKPHFVPYDKGDKDGNRWFLVTPYCLDWSEESVRFLVSNSGKKGQGMPVVRNKDFYFREGFCWSDINTIYLKCRLKGKSVHDVKSMSLFSLMQEIPDWFYVCIINSSFISEYVNDFLNNTQTFQINDARQLPIIIPSRDQLEAFHRIFDSAYSIKLKQFADVISDSMAAGKLADIQQTLDAYVIEYYGLSNK